MKLFVWPVSGGTATQIGAGCGLMERTSVWSPDGRRILFLGSCGSDVPTAWASTVDGKDLRSNHDLYALWQTIHFQPVIDQWIADPPRVLVPDTVGDATYITAVPLSANGSKVTGPPQRLASLTDHVIRVSAAFNGRMVLSVCCRHVPYLESPDQQHGSGDWGTQAAYLWLRRGVGAFLVERRREGGVHIGEGEWHPAFL